MSNSFFQFKQFRIEQVKCAMKVCTDSCIFGAWISVPHSTKQILDIGTGTGLLSLMLAQKSTANITAIEIDKDAYAQAKFNFENSKWKESISIILGDLRTYSFDKKFDFIICNPPFFKDKIVSYTTAEQIAKHSTHLQIEELFFAIDKLLQQDGKCALLFPYFRKEEIEKIAAQYHLQLEKTLYLKQTPNHDFFRYIALFSKDKVERIEHQSFSIKDKQDSYSEEIKNLLQPYYLNL